MKSIYFSYILLVFSIFNALPQKKDNLKDYFLDAEYFFAQEEYVDALENYMVLYQRGFKNNANINYRMGICYIHIPGQKHKAIPHLEFAITNVKNNNLDSKYKEEKAPLDAYLYLGIAYRINNKLDKAIETFKKYREMVSPNDLMTLKFIDKEIESCLNAREFMKNPISIKKTNLGRPINNSLSNFRAVVSGDGNTIVYMTKLPFYNGVFYSRKINNKWSEPINITAQLQSDGDQYVCHLSYDGSILLLTKEDAFNSDIYISRFENGQWTKSVPLPGKVNSRFWESHACLSYDGKILYFASNRTGSIGGTDIFMATYNEKTKEWDNIVNLGRPINTELNEDFPFITEDGKTLFFSSQGHKGMGGYDIFKSYLKDDGTWTNPENVGYPINTTDDNLFLFPYNNGNTFFVSLFEDEGFGQEDIYKIEIIIPEDIEKSFTISEHTDKQNDNIPETKKDTIKETTTTEVIKKELILRPIYFEFNSYVLDNEGKKVLDELIPILKELNTIKLKITGHTDSIGSDDYNIRLSTKRALAVKNYLIQNGISAERIKTEGCGEKNFVAINSNPDGSDNPEGRKYNRRAEIELHGKELELLIIIKPDIPENLRLKK